jgi:hypothetical protein
MSPRRSTRLANAKKPEPTLGKTKVVKPTRKKAAPTTTITTTKKAATVQKVAVAPTRITTRTTGSTTTVEAAAALSLASKKRPLAIQHGTTLSIASPRCSACATLFRKRPAPEGGREGCRTNFIGPLEINRALELLPNEAFLRKMVVLIESRESELSDNDIDGEGNGEAEQNEVEVGRQSEDEV